MNTQYAKQKVEKLMAVANHPTTNPNEAANARDMAKKVAEKYGVLTWFYLTYEKVVNKVKVDNYTLNDRFRWIDLTNTLYALFGGKFRFHVYGQTRKTGYWNTVILEGTEKQVEFLDEIYKIILKSKNQFKKGCESKGASCHRDFTFAVCQGFCGEPVDYKSDLYKNAYNTGKLIRSMYEEKAGKGW